MVGAIIVWGNLPQRMTKAEEQLDDLKSWTKEMMGYTRAQQEWNQQQQQQQASPQPWVFLRQERDLQIFRDPDNIIKCCDGVTCWEWDVKTKCRR